MPIDVEFLRDGTCVRVTGRGVVTDDEYRLTAALGTEIRLEGQMGSGRNETFQLSGTYAFLRDGGEAPLVVMDADFWRDLMSPEPKSPGASLVAKGSGWLVGVYSITKDAGAWEMHPAGDELLAMLTGEMELVLEQSDGEVTVPLKAGRAFLVPRGTWHRQVVRRPGEYLGVTYGKGTRHRPR